jgi:hypothetical protein
MKPDFTAATQLQFPGCPSSRHNPKFASHGNGFDDTRRLDDLTDCNQQQQFAHGFLLLRHGGNKAQSFEELVLVLLIYGMRTRRVISPLLFQ